MTGIAERIAAVRHRVEQSARAAGRAPSEVHLLAVSKTVSSQTVRDAYACGLRDFGENYVQELSRKAADLTDLPDIAWHMIGHLQKNKARHVVRSVAAVHAVHSPELARELGRRAAASEGPAAWGLGWQGRPNRLRLPVLVEVNVGGEEQKAGCVPAALGALLDAIEQEPALELAGLMTVPPYTEDPVRARPFFDQLTELRARYGGPARLPELSMGMTHDLEVAIAAGSTIVRVGTAIFGSRTVI
ncbi:YggS family pyridoxal phosphate-dependent enzyme [Myxococcota bacterium]